MRHCAHHPIERKAKLVKKDSEIHSEQICGCPPFCKEINSMTRYMSRGILLCLLSLMYTVWVMASPTGSITGFVKDSTGALVPGVKVTLTNTRTNAQLSTISNENGGFQFPQLAPASYSLVVESPGFKRTVVNALVQVDQITRVDVVLEVGESHHYRNAPERPPIFGFGFGHSRRASFSRPNARWRLQCSRCALAIEHVPA